MNELETRLAEVEAEHTARQRAVAVAADFRQESRGYGFVCADCHCEVDEYVRGPHLPGCSLAKNNRSIMPGWEAFVGFIQNAE